MSGFEYNEPSGDLRCKLCAAEVTLDEYRTHGMCLDCHVETVLRDHPIPSFFPEDLSPPNAAA